MRAKFILKKRQVVKILLVAATSIALVKYYNVQSSAKDNAVNLDYKFLVFKIDEDLTHDISYEDVHKYIEITERKRRKNNIILVNKENSVSSSYVPENLVTANVRSQKSIRLQKETCKALEELFNEASNEGMYLYLVSGYRSYSEQKTIYNNSLLRSGRSHTSCYVAKPGHSEHQLGLAADVTSVNRTDLVASFGNTKEGKWLKENAHKFGFIIRYQQGKEDVTEYGYEPWHIRYVGKIEAQEIKESGLALEEYLASE